MTHLVNVSGGMASAVALFRVIERYGISVCKARFADTNYEDADVYRFINVVECVSGVKIERLNQGKNIWDVFFDRMMMTDPVSGGCVASYHLKKLPLREHSATIDGPLTIHVGFGPDEDDRITKIQKNNPCVLFDFPLTWTPRMWRCDLADNLRARGIEPPSTYALGYPHANCRNRCILAGIKQMTGVLKDDRAGYLESEEKEQLFLARLRERGRKEITILKDRRGGVVQNLSLRQLREELESGKRDFDDSFRQSACACMWT